MTSKKRKRVQKKYKKANHNLNTRFKINDIVQRKTPTPIGTTTFVVDNIDKFLIDKLNCCDSVLIVSPFFSSATPLKKAFVSLTKGVTLVTAPSKNLDSDTMNTIFKSWTSPCFGQSSKVLTLASGSGKQKSIAHSKYVVGFRNSKPVFSTTGSYNITGGAPTNIENIVCFEDKEMINLILEECLRIISISKHFY